MEPQLCAESKKPLSLIDIAVGELMPGVSSFFGIGAASALSSIKSPREVEKNTC